MKRSKLAALFMAAALGTASLGSNVSAASFSEFEKDAFEKEMDELNEQMGQLPEIQTESGTAGVSMNVQLGQTGKAMLGMMAPVDVSWLDHATLDVAAAVEGTLTYGNMLLSLNDAGLVSVNYSMDLETKDYYMQIPEVSDVILHANYDELMQQAMAAAGSNMPISAEQYAMIMQICQNLSTNPPAPETIMALVERYVPIILEAFEDGEAREDSYTAGGIAQQAMLMEATMTEAAAKEMVVQLMTTAQNDTDLMALIQQVTAGTEYETTAYPMLQSMIGEALDTMNSQPAESTEHILLRMWADAEENPVGMEVLFGNEGEEASIMCFKTAKEENRWAMDFVMDPNNDPSSTLAATATGTDENGVMTGSAQISFAGTPVAKVDFTQTSDVELINAGQFEGTYNVAPIVDTTNAEASGDSTMNMLAGMALTVNVAQSGNTAGMDVTVTMSGSPLGTISFASESPYAGEVTALNLEGATVIEMTDDEQMNAFVNAIDVDTLMNTMVERLTAVGMPEGFMEQVMQLMGASEDPAVEDMPEGMAVPEESEEAVDEYAVEETEEETAEEEADSVLGAIGGGVAPAAAEEKEESSAPGLLDWNNAKQ